MIKLKEYYEKIMNTKSLAVILIIGVALLMLPGFSKDNTESKTKQEYFKFDIYKYESDLEKKLSNMLSKINGAGETSVMITFSDYGSNIYSQEEQSEKSETNQKGVSKPVLKDSSSGGEEPILIKTELPKIAGVLIVSEGASDAKVRECIKEAVKAVLDVSVKNISVASK
ncbi:MAG: hypothetical protein IKL09_04240 [Clostridia bacterium]|nr:hypothetical protein [Clostridia bacterium]MBR6646707.1 hypothetical protein [Clostridia bacterium]